MSEGKPNWGGHQNTRNCCADSGAVSDGRGRTRKPGWTGNKTPRIELLYFEGCPTYKVARQIIAEVLELVGAPGDLREINVTSEAQARQLKFIGSPTVRIDGRDVDPAPDGAEQYGLKCRVYAVDGKLLGYPPRQVVLAALKEAGYVT